jgi:hypothetical protein
VGRIGGYQLPQHRFKECLEACFEVEFSGEYKKYVVKRGKYTVRWSEDDPIPPTEVEYILKKLDIDWAIFKRKYESGYSNSSRR